MARSRRIGKFSIAVAAGFLSVAGQEIRPARFHVARHVFHDHRDGVHVSIENREELLITRLTDGALGKLFVVSEYRGGILHIRCGELKRHAFIFAELERRGQMK